MYIYIYIIPCVCVRIYVHIIFTYRATESPNFEGEIPTSNALKSFLLTPRSSTHHTKSLCWRPSNFRLWRRTGRELPRRKFHRMAMCFRCSRGCFMMCYVFFNDLCGFVQAHTSFEF